MKESFIPNPTPEQYLAHIKHIIDQFGGEQKVGSVVPTKMLNLTTHDRLPTCAARSQILLETLDNRGLFENNDSLENTLEIGSGTGELTRLLTFRGFDLSGITFSDIETERLRENLRNQPNAHIEQLDVLDLTQKPNGRKTILSLNTTDMFPNAKASMTQVLEAIKTGLTPNGWFFHFQDLMPDTFALFRRHPEKFIIPMFGKDFPDQKLRFFTLSRKSAINFLEIMQIASVKGLSAIWQAYLQMNPTERAIATRMFPEGFNGLFYNISACKHITSPPLESASLEVEFTTFLRSKMEDVGFSNVEVTRITESQEHKPFSWQEKGTSYGFEYSRATQKTVPDLKENVRETATMIVAYGQKN